MGFEFNTAGDKEGFTSANISPGPTVVGDTVSRAFTSGAPQFIRNGLNLDGSKITSLLVKMHGSFAGRL